MTAAIPIPRRFPRLRLIVVPQKRGMGQDALAELTPQPGVSMFFGPLGMIPQVWGTAVNAATGTLSAGQLADLQAQQHLENQQAATNPVTGEVNQALLTQANEESDAEMAAAANVSNLSTGSWLANLSDQIQGQYTGRLGIIGFTPPLGTPVPSAGSGIDWTSILESIALYGGAGLLAYLLAKRLLK